MKNLMLSAALLGCALSAQAVAGTTPRTPAQARPTNTVHGACTEVMQGTEVMGTARVHIEKWVRGLNVPWSMGFLPGGDLLVTERPGRVRLIRRGGNLVDQPVATIEVGERGEGGLLGLAIHPAFSPQNPYFYVYLTAPAVGGRGGANRIVRYKLGSDYTSATLDRVIVPDFPAGTFHNGGRLRFGPDGMLYVGTGDARRPELAQRMDSLAGKILRVTPDGQVPADNPFPGSPVYVLGVRNVQGFDWLDARTMIITDHGPTGEARGYDHDEISIARAGDNLGWPTIFSCEQRSGLVTPVWTWAKASPPGGSIIYRGRSIPEWKGSLLSGILGFGYEDARRLSQVKFTYVGGALTGVSENVYFYGAPPAGYGRLRDIVEGPDGAIYVTTSNCDSRGECPTEKDLILRITGTGPLNGSGGNGIDEEEPRRPKRRRFR